MRSRLSLRLACFFRLFLSLSALAPAQPTETVSPTLTVRSTLVLAAVLVKTRGGQVIFKLTADDFKVTYSGPAPYQLAGVSQINFQLVTFPSNGMIYVTLPSSQSQPFALYIQ
jgi:hypothetical protein